MCKHNWRRVYEQFLLGGAFPVGWECVDCGEYKGNEQMTPAGLGGRVIPNAARLMGPHGGRGETSTGETFKEQIIGEDGKLTIVK